MIGAEHADLSLSNLKDRRSFGSSLNRWHCRIACEVDNESQTSVPVAVGYCWTYPKRFVRCLTALAQLGDNMFD